MTQRTSRNITWLLAASAAVLPGMVEAAGLPQLDPTWYKNQVFWLVVSFGLLYAVVSCVIVPNVRSVLLTRSTAIDEAIREAERAKQVAESAKSTGESANLDARNHASSIMAKTQAEVSRETADALAKLDGELDRKLEKAEVRIEEARVKALQSMNGATASLASAMASKLLGHEVTAGDAEPIVTNLKKAS